MGALVVDFLAYRQLQQKILQPGDRAPIYAEWSCACCGEFIEPGCKCYPCLAKKMHRCEAVTKQGRHCGNWVKGGGVCHIHRDKP